MSLPSHLDLEPKAVLVFKSPEEQNCQETLRLHNPTDKHVFFKVKTTAPKRYCVRPNSGRVDPGATVDVVIMVSNKLQPEEVLLGSKDKFLVQSAVAPAATVPEQLWKSVKKEEVGEVKLKCQFVTEGADAAAETASPNRAPPAHGPYQGKLAGTLSAGASAPVEKSGPVTADEEAELNKALKINAQLKESNRKLEEELTGKPDGLRHRHSSGLASAHSGPVHDFAAPKAKKANPLPMLLAALLIGWAIGHFLI